MFGHSFASSISLSYSRISCTTCVSISFILRVSSRPLFFSGDDDDDDDDDDVDDDVDSVATSVTTSAAIPVVEPDVRGALTLADDDCDDAITYDVVDSASITAAAATAITTVVVVAAGSSSADSVPTLPSHALGSLARSVIVVVEGASCASSSRSWSSSGTEAACTSMCSRSDWVQDFLAGGVSVIAPIVVSWARLLLGDDDDDDDEIEEAAAPATTASLWSLRCIRSLSIARLIVSLAAKSIGRLPLLSFVSSFAPWLNSSCTTSK